MMMPSPEVQLLAVVAVLYVQDAALLLHANEGVLTQDLRGRWRLALGSAQARLFGKNIHLPAFLSMHRPAFRMAWSFEKEGAPLSSGWKPQTQTFVALGRLCVWLAFVEFALFPAVLILYLTDLSLLLTLAVLYGTIAVALSLVWRRRAEWGISTKKWGALCFECLVCPPLAVNLVRRLSLNRCAHTDLVSAARALLPTQDWPQALQLLQARLEDQITLEPEGSPLHQRLQARLLALNDLQEKP